MRALNARGRWLIAVLLRGNLAMAGYVLLWIFRLPSNASSSDLLLRREGP